MVVVATIYLSPLKRLSSGKDGQTEVLTQGPNAKVQQLLSSMASNINSFLSVPVCIIFFYFKQTKNSVKDAFLTLRRLSGDQAFSNFFLSE